MLMGLVEAERAQLNEVHEQLQAMVGLMFMRLLSAGSGKHVQADEALFGRHTCDEYPSDRLRRSSPFSNDDAADLFNNAVPKAIAVPEIKEASMDPGAPPGDPGPLPFWVLGLPELQGSQQY